jgi:hypothetical protein
MLGQPAAGQRETLADEPDRQRGRLDRAERGAGEGFHSFGVEIVAEQGVEEAVNTLERERPTQRHGMDSGRG